MRATFAQVRSAFGRLDPLFNNAGRAARRPRQQQRIDIGNASTDLAAPMGRGVPQANGTIAVEPLMDVAQVGEMVVHMADLPLDANVQFVTLMVTKMPFIGRG